MLSQSKRDVELFNLGRKLFKQGKFGEAEQAFRQSVKQREKVLGTKHMDTFGSKYWLAFALDEQRKRGEAEHLFRQLVQQQEKALGAEHAYTLESKHCLGRTLFE